MPIPPSTDCKKDRWRGMTVMPYLEDLHSITGDGLTSSSTLRTASSTLQDFTVPGEPGSRGGGRGSARGSGGPLGASALLMPGLLPQVAGRRLRQGLEREAHGSPCSELSGEEAEARALEELQAEPRT